MNNKSKKQKLIRLIEEKINFINLYSEMNINKMMNKKYHIVKLSEIE